MCVSGSLAVSDRVWLCHHVAMWYCRAQTVLLLCLVVVAMAGIPSAESIESGTANDVRTPSERAALLLTSLCRAVLPTIALILAYAVPVLKRTKGWRRWRWWGSAPQA